MDNAKTFGSILVAFSLILLVALVFVKVDFDKKNELLCNLYEENQKDMASCPAHQTGSSWLLTSAFGIAFLTLGMGGYLTFMPKQIQQVVEEKKEFKEIDLAKLDEEEKKVYEIIKGKGGSAFQSDLIKDTSHSKVTITRILDKLEMIGVLERKRRGMTNIVVLK